MKHPGQVWANALGLSGAWVPDVAHDALGSRNVRLPTGTYFLHWDRFGIIWLEDTQGPDSRIPSPAYWVYAYRFPDTRPSKGLTQQEHDESAGRFVFRAYQEFPHREALLRQVGFHQWEGRFYLLECMPTDVDWEWK